MVSPRPVRAARKYLVFSSSLSRSSVELLKSSSAFKVAAYAPTAAWVAGVFALLPILSVLTILGLYSLYLLYVGLPMLMRTPPERAIGYIIAVIVCAVIVWLLIFTLPLMLLGMRMI